MRLCNIKMDSVWQRNDIKDVVRYATPKMIYYRDRVVSFQNWPVQLLQNKHALASAGFYYTNNSDIVKCFSCGLRLGQWLKSDDIWKEHYKWSPNCPYINMVGSCKLVDGRSETYV